MSTHTTSTIPAKDRRTRSFIRVLFGIYLFFFLYGPGSDTIALAHWHIAHGATNYNPLVGAILFTAMALWLARFLERHIHYSSTHCVQAYILPTVLCTAVPGMLIPSQRTLALVSGAAAILLWLICLRPANNQTSRHHEANKAASDWCVAPYIHLFLLFIFTGLTGVLPSSVVYEQRMTEALYHQADAEHTLSIGQDGQTSTPALTALRAYALSQTTDGMGERLFSYPIGDEGAAQLLLQDTCGPHRRALADTILKDLGLRTGIALKGNIIEILRKAAERRPHGMARDYYLCGLLLNRDLERFAHELPRYYVVSDSTRIPTHYAEALVLYDRTYPQPQPVYPEASTTADYRDFREMLTQNRQSAPGLVWEKYHNKYWWFYYRPTLHEQPKTKP